MVDFCVNSDCLSRASDMTSSLFLYANCARVGNPARLLRLTEIRTVYQQTLQCEGYRIIRNSSLGCNAYWGTESLEYKFRNEHKPVTTSQKVFYPVFFKYYQSSLFGSYEWLTNPWKSNKTNKRNNATRSKNNINCYTRGPAELLQKLLHYWGKFNKTFTTVIHKNTCRFRV